LSEVLQASFPIRGEAERPVRGTGLQIRQHFGLLAEGPPDPGIFALGVWTDAAAHTPQGGQRAGTARGTRQAAKPDFGKLMRLQDESALDRALAELLADGVITRDQVTRAKSDWNRRRAQNSPMKTVKPLMEINNEAEFNAALP
jgi:hypothetical protein